MLAGHFLPDKIFPYKSIDGINLNLHLFQAITSDDALTPCIIFFFGGGWIGGSPTQFYPHCRYFADRGMLALAAEYRVQNQHGTTPFECVKDGKSALRYIRKHVADLRINADQIIAAGGSAGGHVAAATLLNKYDEVGEDLLVSSRPDALVLFNPVFDNGPDGFGFERVKEDWPSFSPMHNINSTTPPTVIFLGTEDSLIPVETARKYQHLMRQVGGFCELHLYEDQVHGFFNYNDGNNPYYSETILAADQFLVTLGVLQPKTNT